MAVITNSLESRLRVTFQTGVDGEGNPVLTTRSYNRVKSGATDDAVYQLASTLAGLQKNNLYEVRRVNEVQLEEQLV